jgi:hypothetical protein
MRKKKIQLANLGKSPKKEHLQLVHPFLRTPYRKLDTNELESEATFKELFGESAKVEIWKLRAIYEYQN